MSSSEKPTTLEGAHEEIDNLEGDLAALQRRLATADTKNREMLTAKDEAELSASAANGKVALLQERITQLQQEVVRSAGTAVATPKATKGMLNRARALGVSIPRG